MTQTRHAMSVSTADPRGTRRCNQNGSKPAEAASRANASRCCAHTASTVGAPCWPAWKNATQPDRRARESRPVINQTVIAAVSTGVTGGVRLGLSIARPPPATRCMSKPSHSADRGPPQLSYSLSPGEGSALPTQPSHSVFCMSLCALGRLTVENSEIPCAFHDGPGTIKAIRGVT